MGDVVADLNRRRGQVAGMDSRNGAQVIKANVPLSEMFGYVTSLRTVTSAEQLQLWSFLTMMTARRILQKKYLKLTVTLNLDKMSQKIRIKLKSYDHNLVDKSAEKIVKTVKTTVP